MSKFKATLIGGFQKEDVISQFNQQAKNYNKNLNDLNEQINKLLQETIELRKENTLLKQEIRDLKKAKQIITDSNEQLRSVLIKQVNVLNSSNSYDSHKHNLNKVKTKYFSMNEKK